MVDDVIIAVRTGDIRTASRFLAAGICAAVQRYRAFVPDSRLCMGCIVHRAGTGNGQGGANLDRDRVIGNIGDLVLIQIQSDVLARGHHHILGHIGQQGDGIIVASGSNGIRQGGVIGIVDLSRSGNDCVVGLAILFFAGGYVTVGAEVGNRVFSLAVGRVKVFKGTAGNNDLGLGVVDEVQ